MGDFEEKLNQILSNPQAMEQIMSLANSIARPPGQGGQEGQGAAEGTLDVVDGHLTREGLETMTKANLEKLAKDMGVEIPRGATKALIIERLAAVTVEAPAPDGGAQ